MQYPNSPKYINQRIAAYKQFKDAIKEDLYYAGKIVLINYDKLDAAVRESLKTAQGATSSKSLEDKLTE